VAPTKNALILLSRQSISGERSQGRKRLGVIEVAQTGIRVRGSDLAPLLPGADRRGLHAEAPSNLTSREEACLLTPARDLLGLLAELLKGLLGGGRDEREQADSCRRRADPCRFHRCGGHSNRLGSGLGLLGSMEAVLADEEPSRLPLGAPEPEPATATTPIPTGQVKLRTIGWLREHGREVLEEALPPVNQFGHLCALLDAPQHAVDAYERAVGELLGAVREAQGWQGWEPFGEQREEG
jgi:hypothetical protein